MNHKEITEIQVREVLEETKSALEQGDWSAIRTGVQFQEWVLRVIAEISERKGLTAKGNGTQAFPDISIDHIGIEVKYTQQDSWCSVGNSVLESTRVPGVDLIFILFGNGGRREVRWGSYEQCLGGILVTHSPRYQVSMELGEGEDIFSKMGTSYDVLRRGDPIAEFKKYYRAQYKPEQGQQLWWMDNEAGVHPLVRTLESMDYEDQENIVADCMVRFPEVFIPRGEKGFMLKYERPALHIMVEYQAVSHSLRDKFSASGRRPDPTGGSERIPHILYKCYLLAEPIHDFLRAIPPEILAESWSSLGFEGVTLDSVTHNAECIWESLLDRISCWSSDGVTASEIYRTGLRSARMRKTGSDRG